ncbi:ABC transporter ATP-binding protein [uncultured Mobiluncus sp.]|uniref:ABC transporter ATP-binding protein n=1 Tax=uncultured Mobiluncus sp. TaxID=293425 RepID=UPI00288BA6A1|nr:ABC transporter ATP-binding protein [uncultured Mobiluncus sp.]
MSQRDSFSHATVSTGDSPRPPAITVEHLSKTFRIYHEHEQSLKRRLLKGKKERYELFHALDDINLEIPEGKTFGLLGQNGSGKSTLLKCIARILSPDSGTVTTRGRVAAMLEVGSGFHPDLTGRENIFLNGSILGMSKAEIERKLDAIVEFSGVEKFIDQPVKSYSSGMYVRLGFSVAIHVEPEILLVDEILAVGDLEFQEKCMAKFAQFRSEGRTVVVVSHGLEQMRTFCDEAAWLDHGKLVAVGGASEIVDRYSNMAHGARRVEQGGGTRFGSGQVEVTKMEWLGPEGAKKVHTGDPVTIRLTYEAKERIEKPIFGVSVDTREGFWVWGYHALDAGYVPEYIDPGSGTIEVKIPRLPLRPGTYFLSCSIQNIDSSVMYDAWQKGLAFDVLPWAGMESAGVVTFNSTFTNLTPPVPMVELPARDAAYWEALTDPDMFNADDAGQA